MSPGDFGFGEFNDEEPPPSFARTVAEVFLVVGGLLVVIGFAYLIGQ